MHKMTSTIALAALFALANAGPAQAQTAGKMSIKEQKMASETQAAVDEEVASTNQRCGTKITATVDWNSFKNVADTETHSISGYCQAPLRALSTVCDSDVGKKAVNQQVKKLTCAYGGAKKRSLDVKSGTIIYKVDFGSANDDDFAREQLESKL